MKKCSKCGFMTDNVALNFCTKCGNKLTECNTEHIVDPSKKTHENRDTTPVPAPQKEHNSSLATAAKLAAVAVVSAVIVTAVFLCLNKADDEVDFSSNISLSESDEATISTTSNIAETSSETVKPQETVAETTYVFSEEELGHESFGSLGEHNAETSPELDTISVTETTAEKTMAVTTAEDIVRETTPRQDNDWKTMHIISKHTYFYGSPDKSITPPESHAVYYNDTIEISGYEDGFYYARTKSGSDSYMYGYIPAEFVEDGAGNDSDENSLYNVSYVRITADTANIRSTPDKERNDNILGTAKYGDSFEVYSYDGYWYEINYYGSKGYVSYKMVT